MSGLYRGSDAGLVPVKRRWNREQRISQISQILRKLGKTTAYQVAREIGVSPRYVQDILWDMAERGIAGAEPVPHRGKLKTKWVWELL